MLTLGGGVEETSCQLGQALRRYVNTGGGGDTSCQLGQALKRYVNTGVGGGVCGRKLCLHGHQNQLAQLKVSSKFSLQASWSQFCSTRS